MTLGEFNDLQVIAVELEHVMEQQSKVIDELVEALDKYRQFLLNQMESNRG